MSDKRRAEAYKMAMELAAALELGDLTVDDLDPAAVIQLKKLIGRQVRPSTHDLKCWPQPFDAIWDGRKRFEIRKNDRNFGVDDRLVLWEWDPISEKYTGRKIEAQVTYIVRGGEWGLPDDLCVMSISVTSRVET